MVVIVNRQYNIVSICKGILRSKFMVMIYPKISIFFLKFHHYSIILEKVIWSDNKNLWTKTHVLRWKFITIDMNKIFSRTHAWPLFFSKKKNYISKPYYSFVILDSYLHKIIWQKLIYAWYNLSYLLSLTSVKRQHLIKWLVLIHFQNILSKICTPMVTTNFNHHT